MTEKQAILRDLKVIAILNNKIDYSDHDNIGAVLELNPKSLFSTEYGQRYLDRIRAMYDGKEYEHTCILCGSPLDGANPVCDNCYKMITLGNAVAPKKPQQIVSEETAGEEKAAPAGEAEAAPVAETEAEAAPEEAPVAEAGAASDDESETANEAAAAPEEAPVAEAGDSSAGERETANEAAVSEETETAPAVEAEGTAAETVNASVAETENASEAGTAAESAANDVKTEAASEAGAATEAETASTVEAGAAKEADVAEAAEEEAEEDEDKSPDDNDLIHGSENTVKGEKMIELGRALILLFVIMCFAIAIVCGIVLGIRDLRIKNQKREQEQFKSEAVIEDADLRDYYSMISTNVGYTLTIKAEF